LSRAAHDAPARWTRLFLPFAAGYFVSYVLRNANAVIAPELTRELTLTAADLGLLTSAYFLAFAAAQIPLGMLLDRYGPRRVEAALMLFAAAGTLLFALGETITQLAIARGLIGLGVSACLMAGLKNFSQWYPPERHAAFAGAIMVAGGLGAVTASVPLEALLPLLGWRGVFLALTALIVVITAYLFFFAADHHGGISRSTLGQQWGGVAHVFGSRRFWRFAPLTALFSGGFMAIQGLWVVPWLINVDARTRADAAGYLLAIALAMLASYLFATLFATRLIRRGITAATLLGGSMLIGWCAFLLNVAGAPPALLWWIGFGFFLSATQYVYTAVTHRFPLELSGRVSTALNLMAFVGAFGLQWGIGVIVDSLTAEGWPAASAYRAAFALVVALQALAWIWFAVEGRREHRAASNTPTPLEAAP
jgi:nitrate/nitrite transporter NarK